MVQIAQPVYRLFADLFTAMPVLLVATAFLASVPNHLATRARRKLGPAHAVAFDPTLLPGSSRQVESGCDCAPTPPRSAAPRRA